MPLDSASRRDLRGLAHPLKPVVIVAERGLTAGVLGEIERALSDHELIKVKLAITDRLQRAGIADDICGHTGADRVTMIGKIIVLFRANPTVKPELSNLLRGHLKLSVPTAKVARSSAAAATTKPLPKPAPKRTAQKRRPTQKKRTARPKRR